MGVKTKENLTSSKIPNSEHKKNSPKKKEEKEDKKSESKKDKEMNMIQWYINNKIDEKKIKIKQKIQTDIFNGNECEDNEYEDVQLSKNIEEYINVVCRIKNDVEQNENTEDGDIDVVKKVASHKLVIDTFHMGSKDVDNFEYTYDRVYDISNNNHFIFNDYIKHNIKNIFQGINCSILAYGQTNSGKTYTMLGNFEFINNLYKLCIDNKENQIKDDAFSLTYEELTNCISNEPHNIGIIPACINYIFNYINFHKNKNLSTINKDIKEFTVTLSIIEIYNEVIYDLITGESNLVVQTIDSLKNESVIKNLKEVEINDIVSALHYLEQGVKNRKIAFTNMNKTSSRSHLIFIIKINRFIPSLNIIKCGKLCLVDLAGSERLKQTKATGTIKIEATMINKSLTVLSKVINALAVMQIKDKMEKNDNTKNDLDMKKEDGETTTAGEDFKTDDEKCKKENAYTNSSKNKTKKNKTKHAGTSLTHIPYRDSKLTRVLSDSLGNNCKSILICTLASQLKYINETASTIKFAQRAKMVKAKPIVREEKVIENKTDETYEQNKNQKKSEKGLKNGTCYIGSDYKNHLYEDSKQHIFFNFNSNNIMQKDLILFCFHICIFSYICGYKTTGKIKYMDFFIESYKNKIDMIKQQICDRNKGIDSNDVNEYLRKTFDELKIFTEEERLMYNKMNEKNMKRFIKEKKSIEQKVIEKTKEEKVEDKVEEKATIEDGDSKGVNRDHDDNIKTADLSDNTKENVSDKEKEQKSKLTLEYIKKFNEEQGHEKHDPTYDRAIGNADNITKTDISKDNHTEDDEDALIEDILIKMKNDICNILKFNLTTLRSICPNKEEDENDAEKKFEEIIHIVSKVKENNDIFLHSEFKDFDDKNKEEKNIQKDKENKDSNSKNKENDITELQEGEENDTYNKEKVSGKNTKGKKILKTKNLKEMLLPKQAKNIDGAKKGNKQKMESIDKSTINDKKNDKKDEDELEVTENPLNHVDKVLSIKNIKHIFDYINNNFSKFISDFTTDKSTVFTNFDLNENLDRQLIEKRETIYNFIHASTMFHQTNTLSNLNSNYFYNKIQSQLNHNFRPNKNIRLVKSINNMLSMTMNKEDEEFKIKMESKLGDALGDNKLINKDKIKEKQENIKLENMVTPVLDNNDTNMEDSPKAKKKVRIRDQSETTETDEKKSNDENENIELQQKEKETIQGIQTNEDIKSQSINVYHNEQILQFTKLMEDQEFQKFYNYLTETENITESEKEKNIYDLKKSNTTIALLELESKLNEEIQKINDNITVNIRDVNTQVHTHIGKKDKKRDILKNENKEFTDNKEAPHMLQNPSILSKQFANMELTYLEKKRNANVCIKGLFNKFHKMFQKRNGSDSVEDKNNNYYPRNKIINILGIETEKNKKLLEENLDSYNVRNFYINNKKVYLLNEAEYMHLNELINYKNIVISVLTEEYKRIKLSV